MVRDGLSEADAENLVKDCKTEFYKRLEMGEIPYDILETWFGIESDYILELI